MSFLNNSRKTAGNLCTMDDATHVVFKRAEQEMFRCRPVEFRRVHVLDPNTRKLAYSHTDLVVQTINQHDAHIEISQLLLEDGDYVIETKGFQFAVNGFRQGPSDALDWCKKVIFACFPNIRVVDVYGSVELSPTTVHE